jgi:hypothetical protein
MLGRNLGLRGLDAGLSTCSRNSFFAKVVANEFVPKCECLEIKPVVEIYTSSLKLIVNLMTRPVAQSPTTVKSARNVAGQAACKQHVHTPLK